MRQMFILASKTSLDATYITTNSFVGLNLERVPQVKSRQVQVHARHPISKYARN